MKGKHEKIIDIVSIIGVVAAIVLAVLSFVYMNKLSNLSKEINYRDEVEALLKNETVDLSGASKDNKSEEVSGENATGGVSSAAVVAGNLQSGAGEETTSIIDLTGEILASAGGSTSESIADSIGADNSIDFDNPGVIYIRETTEKVAYTDRELVSTSETGYHPNPEETEEDIFSDVQNEEDIYIPTEEDEEDFASEDENISDNFGSTGTSSEDGGTEIASGNNDASPDSDSIENSDKSEQSGGNAGDSSSAGNSQAKVSGRLHVDGTYLCDESNNPVQLRGVSTHGLAWFPQYVNETLFEELATDWGANVVRLALYTDEYGGYCNGGDKEGLLRLIDEGVNYATRHGLYVIIDWHILSDNDPNIHKSEALIFFDEVSRKYADYDNVIYEICNEPNGGTSWNTIKNYALEVITVIRANSPDAVIIVGTPNWSQYVEDAAADPITEYDNIMYTLHFYAATHGSYLREAMERAIKSGLPVFITEFGTCDASGSGMIDEASSKAWIDLCDKYKVSYVCWNLANKSETSSLFTTSCNKTNGFTVEDLSEQGQWLYSLLRNRAGIGNSSANNEAGGEDGKSDNSSDKANENASGNEAGSSTDNFAGNVSENGQSGNASGSEDNSGNNETNKNQNNASSESGEKKYSGATGSLEWAAEVVNEWDSNDGHYAQLNISVKNYGEAVENWDIYIEFDGIVEVDNYWNCEIEILAYEDGLEGILCVKNAEYNGGLGKNATADSIGVIVKITN